jgi:hypothetical protein
LLKQSAPDEPVFQSLEKSKVVMLTDKVIDKHRQFSTEPEQLISSVPKYVQEMLKAADESKHDALDVGRLVPEGLSRVVVISSGREPKRRAR